MCACKDTRVAAPASLSHTRRGRPAQPSRRLLVISHPAVVSVNQEVYRELRGRGWELTLVVPSSWRNEYRRERFPPQPLTGMEDALKPVPVALRGRVQRHLYLVSTRLLCARVRPQVAFVEAEPFALAAAQWGRAFARLGVPFGVQCYENIDRALPWPVRRLRSRVLRDAAFVAARSQTAAQLARAWGAAGEVELAPPAVSESIAAGAQRERAAAERPFTVGYAGRLTESKGLLDLLAAVRLLAAPVQLVLIGNGELRAQLEGQALPGSRVRVVDDLTHAQMARGYAQLDVLAMPSRTTPAWKEQFGRAIVEALACGVPVVGSDSGEIPWLISLTGGGLVFAEGDVRELAAQLGRLRAQPQLRAELAARGREAVERMFSVAAACDPLERMLIGAAERSRR